MAGQIRSALLALKLRGLPSHTRCSNCGVRANVETSRARHGHYGRPGVIGGGASCQRLVIFLVSLARRNSYRAGERSRVTDASGVIAC